MVGVADFFDDGFVKGRESLLLRRQVQLQSCQSILHQNVVCQGFERDDNVRTL